MLDGIVLTTNLGSTKSDKFLTRSQAWSLYLLHFLFTWNARTYEYAAVGFHVNLALCVSNHIRSSSLLLYTRTP